jgi:hypothetical protein
MNADKYRSMPLSKMRKEKRKESRQQQQQRLSI